jgi:hypothetical protein
MVCHGFELIMELGIHTFQCCWGVVPFAHMPYVASYASLSVECHFCSTLNVFPSVGVFFLMLDVPTEKLVGVNHCWVVFL